MTVTCMSSKFTKLHGTLRKKKRGEEGGEQHKANGQITRAGSYQNGPSHGQLPPTYHRTTLLRTDTIAPPS